MVGIFVFDLKAWKTKIWKNSQEILGKKGMSPVDLGEGDGACMSYYLLFIIYYWVLFINKQQCSNAETAEGKKIWSCSSK